jgi:hypothetical protein
MNLLAYRIEECTRAASDRSALLQFLSEVGLDNGDCLWRALLSERFDVIHEYPNPALPSISRMLTLRSPSLAGAMLHTRGKR